MGKNLEIERLKTRQQYLGVARGGNKAVQEGLVVQYLPPLEGEDKVFVGLTVSAKTGGAVKRSRIKRRLRQVIRDIIPALGKAGASYVVIARPAALKRDFGNLKKDLQSAIETLHARKPGKRAR